MANQAVASLLQNSVRCKAMLLIATLGISCSSRLDILEREGRLDAEDLANVQFRVTNVVVFFKDLYTTYTTNCIQIQIYKDLYNQISAN